MQLNPEQLAAVETTEGAVRVAAGAGTGKTQALTQRYIHIVRDLGILPKNILCATFTNRAANEMKARVREELGDLDLGLICTFHAFCVQLLKEDIHVLHYPKNFIILDVEDERQILQRVFAALHLTLKDLTIQRAIDEILEARKFQATDYIDDFYQLDNEQLLARAEAATNRSDQIFLRYLYEQKISYGLDFNDLINFATYILQHFPDILEKWQTRMEYVLVDEFQDVSLRQYTIAKLLSGKHGNLFIVGDPDQTIYTWRGSHLKLFLDFPKEFPEAKTIVLKRNYRSTPQILATGNTLIAKNAVRFPKELEAQSAPGPRPRYCHAKSQQDEAQWIVRTIQQLVSSEFEERPYRLSQIAILYRAHYLSRVIEEQLIQAKIPYKLYSGTEFYCRAEIKDVLCYLRMVTAGDNLAFLRTIDNPSRRIGKKKLARLEELARQKACTLYEALKGDLGDPVWRNTGAATYVGAIQRVRALRELHTVPPIDQLLQRILDLSGYEAAMRLESNQARLDNLAELKRAVAEAAHADPDATLEDFLNQVALLTNLDHAAARDTVKLMTVHTAKGLEFPCVFVAGLNEGVFPSRKVVTPDEMDEERRIAYVAFTRAKERLFLSDAEGVDNDNLCKFPSRFIFDAGEENLDCVQPIPEELLQRAKAYIATDEARLKAISELFTPGQKVRHQVFGDGTILQVNLRDACYEIQFEKLATPRTLRFGTALAAIE